MKRTRRHDRQRELLSRLRRHLEISQDAWRQRRIRTRSARYAACLAERLGMIERPKSCSWCRRHLRLQRHHWDYEQPLVVVYLCRDCHMLADTMARAETA